MILLVSARRPLEYVATCGSAEELCLWELLAIGRGGMEATVPCVSAPPPAADCGGFHGLGRPLRDKHGKL